MAERQVIVGSRVGLHARPAALFVKAASQHYEQAQDALRRGDFAEYGRLIKLLEDDLAKLRAATGQ